MENKKWREKKKKKKKSSVESHNGSVSGYYVVLWEQPQTLTKTYVLLHWLKGQILNYSTIMS